MRKSTAALALVAVFAAFFWISSLDVAGDSKNPPHAFNTPSQWFARIAYDEKEYAKMHISYYQGAIDRLEKQRDSLKQSSTQGVFAWLEKQEYLYHIDAVVEKAQENLCWWKRYYTSLLPHASRKIQSKNLHQFTLMEVLFYAS